MAKRHLLLTGSRRESPRPLYKQRGLINRVPSFASSTLCKLNLPVHDGSTTMTSMSASCQPSSRARCRSAYCDRRLSWFSPPGGSSTAGCKTTALRFKWSGFTSSDCMASLRQNCGDLVDDLALQCRWQRRPKVFRIDRHVFELLNQRGQIVKRLGAQLRSVLRAVLWLGCDPWFILRYNAFLHVTGFRTQVTGAIQTRKPPPQCFAETGAF